MITHETLRQYTYSNDHLITGPVRGICVEFSGLGCTVMYAEDTERTMKLAKAGIVYLNPYLNPWAWMNRQAQLVTDEIVDVIKTHFAVPDAPVCSVGGSMGGQSCLVYARYTKHRVVSVVANCPVCDLCYHYTERPDLPRTLMSAFFEESDFDKALEAHSPLHLADSMPDIPYHIFHCTADRSVNKEQHSDRLVAAYKAAGKTVTYDIVPDRGHCDLTPEARDKYDEYIFRSF